MIEEVQKGRSRLRSGIPGYDSLIVKQLDILRGIAQLQQNFLCAGALALRRNPQWGGISIVFNGVIQHPYVTGNGVVNRENALVPLDLRVLLDILIGIGLDMPDCLLYTSVSAMIFQIPRYLT